jgi:hypothetical protein
LQRIKVAVFKVKTALKGKQVKDFALVIKDRINRKSHNKQIIIPVLFPQL